MRLFLVREDDRPGRGGSGWEDHIEDCVGCEVCEIAVRLWRTNPESSELRFHVKCFNEVIVIGNGTWLQHRWRAQRSRFCVSPLRILISTKVVLIFLLGHQQRHLTKVSRNQQMATNPPKRQAPKPQSSVIRWLLDSDPSIRWQVMRDLTDAPAERGRGRARAGRHRGRGRSAARPTGGRRVVGWRGVEPRVGLHDARPVAAARTGSRSRERPGAPRGGPRPRPGDVAGMWPAGM